MKITKIWFDTNNIYVQTENGKVLSQPLKYYPRLKKASDDERQKFFISTVGIHWRNIDEDISFESFEYDAKQPKLMYVA